MLTETDIRGGGGVPTRLNYFANAHARHFQQLGRYHDKANESQSKQNAIKPDQTSNEIKQRHCTFSNILQAY